MRILELRNSILHYRNEIIVLRDRIIEFKALKNDIPMKRKRLRYKKTKNMKFNRKRCALCKIDVLRASYSRHLKSKKQLEITIKNKANVPGKNPTKPVKREHFEASHTKIKNLYYFIYRILKVAYVINIDNHHDKHANSMITITSKSNETGIDIFHNNRIIIEMSNIYAKLKNQRNSNINYPS